MKKKTGGRLLCLLLAAVFLLAALPPAASAAETGGYSLMLESVEAPEVAPDKIVFDETAAAPASNYDMGDLYSQLTTRQKACYDALAAVTFEQITAAAEVAMNGTAYHRVTVDVPGVNGLGMVGSISDGQFVAAESSKQTESAVYTDLCAAIVALRYDRPDILWLGRMRYGFKTSQFQGSIKITGVTFNFHLEFDGKEQEMHDSMMAKARAIAEEASAAPDTYGKVMAAYDLLAEGNTYGRQSERLAHTAYSALITDDACQPVCDGYAKAFKVVCDLLKIPCTTPSTSTGDHMWNNVKMDDGDWYNLDLTWDDRGEELSHDYFLVGSRTVFGEEQFSAQKQHTEENPYNDYLKQDKSGALRPVAFRFPTKNKQAYQYLGQDYEPLTFPDVKRSAWYYAPIEDACQKDLFHGGKNGLFLPADNITRAEIAQVLANAAGADLSSYTGASFTDVPARQWYSPAIAWAKEQKLMNGYKDGSFHPNAPITREELCVVIANSIEESYGSPGAAFPDDGKIAKWARAAVYRCSALGLVQGDEKGNFCPKDSTQRSQGAAIFSRLINAKVHFVWDAGEEEPAEEPETEGPDTEETDTEETDAEE